MIRASTLFVALANIKAWHTSGTSLLAAEDTLGMPPGRLLVLFRENDLLDAYDKPLPDYTAQDFVNLALLFISFINLRRSKK